MTDPSPGAVLRDYVMAEFDAARRALGHSGSHLHRGVHRTRKAIRRIRAVLALVEAQQEGEAHRLERALRKLNRGLSGLRDAHALVQTLDRLLPREGDHGTRRLLRRSRRVAARRRARLVRSHHQLRKVRDVREKLLEHRAMAEALDWQSVRATTLTVAVATAQQRMAEACGRALASDTDEDWHRWRRRVRTLLQQQRACAMAGVGERVSLYDQSLAEQMGSMQDLGLMLELSRHGSIFPKRDRKPLRRFAKAALLRQRRRIASVVRLVPPG